MSLDLDALKTFVKVAELASFTRASDQLGIQKARASFQVKKLEDEVGAKLLQRSTRVVRLTAEGEQLLARARQLLADADELGAMFQAGRSIRGRVRIDLPVNIAREVLIPRLPELLARHPELELTVSTTDRRVEAFREGFDCVLRVGRAGDAGLVGRRLGALRMMNCASPAYLRSHGVPQCLEDLDRHLVVHYSSTLGLEAPSFEHPTKSGYRELPMRSLVTVNSVDAYHAACVAGLGIIQVPRAGMLANLAAGTLVEILPELTCAPMPIFLLHTHARNVPRRVRAVMSWIAELTAPYIEAHAEQRRPR
jgi:DNA-binding transcriptional LysR family regulator